MCTPNRGTLAAQQLGKASVDRGTLQASPDRLLGLCKLNCACSDVLQGCMTACAHHEECNEGAVVCLDAMIFHGVIDISSALRIPSSRMRLQQSIEGVASRQNTCSTIKIKFKSFNSFYFNNTEECDFQR